jgi:hypothetical protein
LKYAGIVTFSNKESIVNTKLWMKVAQIAFGMKNPNDFLFKSHPSIASLLADKKLQPCLLFIGDGNNLAPSPDEPALSPNVQTFIQNNPRSTFILLSSDPDTVRKMEKCSENLPGDPARVMCCEYSNLREKLGNLLSQHKKSSNTPPSSPSPPPDSVQEKKEDSPANALGI